MNRVPSIVFAALFLTACASEPAEEPVAAPIAQAEAVDAPAAPDSSTAQTFEAVVAYAQEQNLVARPLGEIVQAVGLQLLGRPYVEGALDRTAEEALVVDLTGFDCVTYVENVLAIAQAVQAGTPSYDAYVANLEALRYRGGALDGYCSRLHYFTDWMRDNDARGNVRLITQDVGEPFDKTIDFISGHREAYPKLAAGDARSDSLFACIEGVEAGLRGHDLYYVPQDDIRGIYGQLEAGDIIATATDIDGLDVTHTGFVLKDGERTGFLHASLTGEVKVSDDLADYIAGNRVQTGIIVARPLAPGTSG
ncbi:MAG: N-acetylmuramoyl-L-alanine amidase-like domain-containing protein [Bacteroidota bacterium]